MILKITKRRALTLAVAALAVWLLSSAVVACWFTQRIKAPFPEPPPQIAGAKMEDCRLTTEDGQEIGGWFVRGDPQKGCVLLLHGNGGSRREMLPVMQIEDIPQGVPIVFITGSADRHAHLDEVRAIFRQVESHAKPVVFDGAAHVDLSHADPRLYKTTLLEFLDKATRNGLH